MNISRPSLSLASTRNKLNPYGLRRLTLLQSPSHTTTTAPLIVAIRPPHQQSRRMSSNNNNAFPPPALAKVAQEVATLLKSRKETLSVAETAAGGLVSAAILATPGASQVYRGGLTVSFSSGVCVAGVLSEGIGSARVQR